MTSQNPEEAGLITALPNITEVGWRGSDMNERRHNERGGNGKKERESMSDVLIKLLLSQPAKHSPQPITGKSEVIIISHDITSTHC